MILEHSVCGVFKKSSSSSRGVGSISVSSPRANRIATHPLVLRTMTVLSCNSPRHASCLAASSSSSLPNRRPGRPPASPAALPRHCWRSRRPVALLQFTVLNKQPTDTADFGWVSKYTLLSTNSLMRVPDQNGYGRRHIRVPSSELQQTTV